MLVLGTIPRHVIEGAERRRPGQAGIARDVLGLHDPVLAAADCRRQEVILGRAGIGVGVAHQRAFFRIGRHPVVEGIDQLPRLLGRQVLVVGIRALMPPVSLGVGIPGVPHRLPGRMVGRRNLEQLEEGKLHLEVLEGGNRRPVTRVGDRNDAIAVLRILQLVQRDHGGAHDGFLLFQDGVEQDDRGIVLLRAWNELEPLAHVDHVDRTGKQVAVDEKRQRVERLREKIERQEHDGCAGDPPDVDDVEVEHGSIFPCSGTARPVADGSRSSSFPPSRPDWPPSAASSRSSSACHSTSCRCRS